MDVLVLGLMLFGIIAINQVFRIKTQKLERKISESKEGNNH